MKLLYVTDIHGIEWKHNKIFEIASSLKVDVVVNGGDIFTFKGNLMHQDKFITGFLDEYFLRFESKKIYYLGLLGNDDLGTFDDLFQKTCDKYSYVVNMAQTRFQIDGSVYEFIGFNYVSDLPFGLKDRARKDTKNFELPKQIGRQYLSTPNGFEKIEDWRSYVDSLPTIEEELRNLVKPSDMSNTIYIFHDPPANIDLDVTHDGKKVGSKAEYAFLKKKQPKLSLHGHIHETVDVSGQFKENIGNSLSLSAGNTGFEEKLSIVTFNLHDLKTARRLVI